MDWRHTINIKAAWQQAENDEITPAELARYLAEQLRAAPVIDAEVHASRFEELSKNEELDEEAFDASFSELCDWADENAVWIDTMNYDTPTDEGANLT